MELNSSFELLDHRIQQWVWNQGWTSLKDIQESAIPAILDSECDLIISAETAGGKTEAVFLPILTSILKEKECGGYRVLYISPLKSLINDQYRRLADMTMELPIPVIPWHGDISSTKKMRSFNNPKGIVIITPESLESLFVHHHDALKKAFGNLRYVVIDELHSFIPTERGKQLQSLLSRLEIIVGRIIPRIAMSATFSDYDVVKKFLRCDDTIPCKILNAKTNTHETKVLLKEYTYGNNEGKNIQEEIANDIFYNLRGANNLVFTNNRHDCELYGTLLKDKCIVENVPNEFRIHHGSLSKEIREDVEHALQSGSSPITAVCTATMELGVDIGKVKSIAQIETANSISGIRQRLGRSGRRNEPSILRIFSYDYTGENAKFIDKLYINLIQNIAVIELLKEYKYEVPNIERYHFSTLIQQILSVIEEFGCISPKAIWSLLCKYGAFRNIDSSLFLDLLKDLGKKQIITQTNNGQIVIGEKGEYLISDREFYAAFNTMPEFDIINSITGQHIGFLINFIKVGFFIILNGTRWEVTQIDYHSQRAFVVPADYGNISKFVGEGIDIDYLITSKMKEIYLSDDIYPYLDKKTMTIKSIKKARDFFRKNHLDTTSFFSFEEKECALTFAGTKINRTISILSNLLLDKILGTTCLHLDGLTKDDALTILDHPQPQAEELCQLLSRSNKERQKYDYLLSDKLLDKEYANTYLDVDSAWKTLQSLTNNS